MQSKIYEMLNFKYLKYAVNILPLHPLHAALHHLGEIVDENPLYQKFVGYACLVAAMGFVILAISELLQGQLLPTVVALVFGAALGAVGFHKVKASRVIWRGPEDDPAFLDSLRKK